MVLGGKEVNHLQTIFVTRREEMTQEGNPCCFDYFVLVEEASVGDTFLCESYGVQITSVREDQSEICAVPNITTSTQRIDELMERLVKHVVTPATLRDVVEDWLST